MKHFKQKILEVSVKVKRANSIEIKHILENYFKFSILEYKSKFQQVRKIHWSCNQFIQEDEIMYGLNSFSGALNILSFSA